MSDSKCFCLCVFVCWDRQHRVVTFSQASGTFIAVAIINSVPTETSFGWAGQYLSLRVWAVAHTLLLSSLSSPALTARLLPCHPVYLRSVVFSQSTESCVFFCFCFFYPNVKIYGDSDGAMYCFWAMKLIQNLECSVCNDIKQRKAAGLCIWESGARECFRIFLSW